MTLKMPVDISPPITTIPTNYSPIFFSSDMNYSCAHWSGDPTETLETAQKTKVQLLIQKAQISSNHHILDPIRRPEEDRRERDPRAWPGGSIATGPEGNGGYYDRIISIGMFEHVGAECLDEYFRVISSLLHPSHGVMVIDGITRTNKMHQSRSSVPTLIDRYNFPGGCLPLYTPCWTLFTRDRRRS
ncbi:hypothetical protein BDV23DRAFT_146549 [Aspergillus alliaceus]|uniref:S-adenosyl-L-methionine-dependent methyltransferase n=1 Tax=Petromyces alliaceus TaxID=209559 RepID=A0A5N7CMJ5_PETAA|nr:hypothetical protein BDV23DRAFT_146549 [Aspergillus alliaceus]